MTFLARMYTYELPQFPLTEPFGTAWPALLTSNCRPARSVRTVKPCAAATACSNPTIFIGLEMTTSRCPATGWEEVLAEATLAVANVATTIAQAPTAASRPVRMRPRFRFLILLLPMSVPVPS